MMDPREARAEEARAIPIGEIVDRLGLSDLKRGGRELIGPCPACGGRDRFGVHLDKGVYNCRHCGGGDGVGLVRLVLGCSFPEALDFLLRRAEVALSPQEAEARARKRAAEKARREDAAARERQKAIAAARDIWEAGLPAAGTPVAAYLERRGLPPSIWAAPPHALRFHPALRYTVPSPDGRGWQTVHEGPAMLAAILAPSGAIVGVHRTWLDLTRAKGKADIRHGGEVLAAKKTLGSVKGKAIRLSGPRDPREIRTLIMGEGIETTLTALAAVGPAQGRAFWAGVSLGNMAGARAPCEGRRTTRFSDRPDMADAEAFVPPPGLSRLIFIQDGDSDQRDTRAKLMAGLRRAAWTYPGLKVAIVHAGEGRDLNDILLNQPDAVCDGETPERI